WDVVHVSVLWAGLVWAAGATMQKESGNLQAEKTRDGREGGPRGAAGGWPSGAADDRQCPKAQRARPRADGRDRRGGADARSRAGIAARRRDPGPRGPPYRGGPQ